MRKYPAANLARTITAFVESGRRLSARNLFGSKNYALVLLKKGPNEPTAERPANPPYDEPLDDA